MSLSLSTIVFLPLFAIFVLACLNCLLLSFCSHSLPRIYVCLVLYITFYTYSSFFVQKYKCVCCLVGICVFPFFPLIVTYLSKQKY